MVSRLSPTVSAAHRLLGVAILQELDHDIVELHETDVEPLLATLQVRHADRSRIDPSLPCDDLLIRHQRIVDRLAVKISIAHHLVTAEHLGVELERPIHVLDGDAEMLHALEPGAESSVVGVCHDDLLSWACSRIAGDRAA